jgi:hypothetical protein
MRKVLYLILLLTLTIIIAGYLNIDKTRANGDVVSNRGKVKFIPLEGGFYGIVDEGGKHYQPVNLKQGFKVNGLPIYFKAKILPQPIGIYMWGVPIELYEIEKLIDKN